MCKVIAVAMQKGGCAKTSVSLNLGIGLARAGKKVLLIDNDPQGNLTASLGYEEPDDMSDTLASVMMKIINEEPIEPGYGILHHQEGIDLIPGNIELSGLEVLLANVMSRENILKEYIDQIKDQYGYIIIDCMPSLGMTTINAYEMISGHRRMHAAKIVGLTMIPAIVREISDDEAVIYMVDSNIQREELLPSEKAFAFKMKLDAMKRQGKRTDLTSDQNVQKFQTSRDSLASEFGISGPQISRYIRLTELIPDLLELVDNKRLQMTAAVEISYVDKEIQQWICEYIHENGNVKQNQIVILRQELLNGAITQSQLIDILNENAIGRIPKKKVTLSEKKLSQYFPPHYTSAEMEKVIVELLTNWKEQGGAENGF